MESLGETIGEVPLRNTLPTQISTSPLHPHHHEILRVVIQTPSMYRPAPLWWSSRNSLMYQPTQPLVVTASVVLPPPHVLATPTIYTTPYGEEVRVVWLVTVYHGGEQCFGHFTRVGLLSCFVHKLFIWDVAFIFVSSW